MTSRGLFYIALLSLIAWLPIQSQPWQATAVAQSGNSDRSDDGNDGESREERRERRRERWNREDGGDGERRRDRDRDDDSDRGTSESRSDREPTPSNRSSSTAAATSDSNSAASSLGIRNYARSLIAKNDKDGDMMLKGEERSGLRGKAAQADGNNDGVVTLDEMVATLSANAPAAQATQSSEPTAQPTELATAAGGNADSRNATSQNNSDKSPSAGGKSTTDAKDGATDRRLTNSDRKSFRFKPAKERLPSGLPGFFSRDANGDGQISMYEYSRAWNERSASEFIRYDLNNDGIITPKEVAKPKRSSN